jgi:hypothetical protein
MRHRCCHVYSVPCRHCARILLSVVQTLLHGAFVWLQPRSPVVVVVVESGRVPEDPDARAAAAVVAGGSARRVVPAVGANLRAARESHHAAGESLLLPGVRAVDGSLRRADPAAVPQDVKEADARAVVGRAAAGSRAGAVAVPDGEHNLRLHA